MDRLPKGVRQALADAHYTLCAEELEQVAEGSEARALQVIQDSVRAVHRQVLKAGQAVLPLRTWRDQRSGQSGVRRPMRTTRQRCR